MKNPVLNLLSLNNMNSTMSRKAYTGLAALFAVNVLIACSPNPAGQTVVNTTNPGAIEDAGGITMPTIRLAQGQPIGTQHAHGSQPAQGTGDLGGGDAIDGKLLEEYGFDVMKSPEFAKYLFPIDQIFEKFTEIDPETKERKGVPNLITLGAMLRQWFVAPVSLATIEKSQLGVDFVKDPVQQMALQNDREVWIDKNLLPKDERERARLFLHEILMSIYMFQFEKYETLCKRMHAVTECEGIQFSGDEENRAGWEKFFEALLAPRPRRPLNAQDYANVRSVTNILFEKYKEIRSAKEIKSVFLSKNFDPRLFGEFNKDGFSNNEESRALRKSKFKGGEKVSGARIAQDMYARSVGSHLATHCRFDDKGNATANCQLKLGAPRKMSDKNILLPMHLTVASKEGKVLRQIKTQIHVKDEAYVTATSLANGMRDSNVGSIDLGISLPQNSEGQIQTDPREADEIYMLTIHYVGSEGYSDPVGYSVTTYMNAGDFSDWGQDTYEFVRPTYAAAPTEIAVNQDKISGRLYAKSDYPNTTQLSKKTIADMMKARESLNKK